MIALSSIIQVLLEVANETFIANFHLFLLASSHKSLIIIEANQEIIRKFSSFCTKRNIVDIIVGWMWTPHCGCGAMMWCKDVPRYCVKIFRVEDIILRIMKMQPTEFC